MHKPESVKENEIYKILFDFEIKTVYLIPARRQDQVLINKNKNKKKKAEKKRTSRLVDFAVPMDHRVKIKEFEKIDKYLDLARELKKQWNMSDGDISCSRCA